MKRQNSLLSFPNTHVHQKGFTLIELILYIALIAIFIGGAVVFAWDVIYGGAKSGVQREVNQNARFAVKRITHELRNAISVHSVSAQSICLESADAQRNPTLLSVQGGQLRIAWGGGAQNCTNLPNDEALTSDSLSMSNLVFTERSDQSSTSHVDYSFTLESKGVRSEWQESQEHQGSVELRVRL